jgi:hypothetical protein
MAVLLGGSPVHAATMWTPPAHIVSWQWQLSGTVNTSVAAAVFDVDGFDTKASTVATLHVKGARVICYLDVGGAEPDRPDYAQFPKVALGKKEQGWPEYYLDTRNLTVRTVIAARIAMCAGKGFDAIEADLDDTYLEGTRATGLPLTEATGLDYLTWLAATAHASGLAFFAKNGADPAFQAKVAQVAQGEINEQCAEYAECDVLATNIPVLHAEYSISLTRTCAPDRRYPNFTSAKFPVSLTGKRTVCP